MKAVKKYLSIGLLSVVGLTLALGLSGCGNAASSSSSSVSSSTSVVEKLPTPVLISDDGISYTWENTSFTKGYIYELNGEQVEVNTRTTITLKPGDSLRVKALTSQAEFYQDSDWSELVTLPIEYIDITFESEIGTFESYTEQYLCKSREDLPKPKVDGYTFSHWYIKGTDPNYQRFDRVADHWDEDVTLVAHYIPNSYNISYNDFEIKVDYTTGDWGTDINYGLGHDQYTLNSERQSFPYIVPDEFELNKKNEVFAGWYADPELTTLFDFEQYLIEDTNIYPKIVPYETLHYAHEDGKSYYIKNGYNSAKNYFTAPVGPSSYLIDPDSYTFIAHVDGEITLHYQRSDGYQDRSVDMIVYNETTKTKVASHNIGHHSWKEVVINVSKGDLISINLESTESYSGNQTVIMFITGNEISGKIAGVPNHIDVTYGEDFVIPYHEEKEGYKFIGYYTEENGLGTKMTDEEGNSLVGYNIANDVTLYPHYEVEEYSIIYNNDEGVLQDGVVYDEVYTYFDEDIILPTLTKKGYTFDGWYDNDKFEGEAITKIEKGSKGDKELYAKFTLLTLNVDVYLAPITVNFETFGGETIDPITISKDNPSLYPPLAKKEGYVFGGWYLDEQLTLAYDFTYPLIEDSTLYAKFISKEEALYNDVKTDIELDYIDDVVYDLVVPSANEGEVSYRFTFSCKEKYGYQYVIKLYEESNANIDFVIYNETTKQYIQAKNPISSSYYSCTFMANQYDVISVYCYGKDSDKNINIAVKGDESKNIQELNYFEETKIQYGATYNLPVYNYSALEFMGYYSEPNGQGTQLTDKEGSCLSSWGKDVDTTVYAYYVADAITVSYDLDGAYLPSEIILKDKFTKYESFVLPNITKTGHEFKYWYVDNNGEHRVVTTIDYSIGKDAVIKAHFELSKYTVSVVYENNPEFNEEVEVYYGEKYTVSLHKLEGYSLEGFYHGNDLVASANTGTSFNFYYFEEDITIYPKYDIYNYYIYYGFNEGEPITPYEPLTTYTVATDHELPELTKEYHTFLGWYDGNNTLVENLLGHTGTLYLNAKFEPVEFTLTVDTTGYDPNVMYYAVYYRESSAYSDPYSVEIDTKNGIIFHEPEEKEGYIFKGWSIYEGALVMYDFAKEFDSNEHLYAYWEEVDADGVFSVYNPKDIFVRDSIKMAFISYFDENVKVISSTNENLVYKIYKKDGTLIKETSNKEELSFAATAYEVYYLEITNPINTKVDLSISLEASKIKDGGKVKSTESFEVKTRYGEKTSFSYYEFSYANFRGYYTEPNGQGELVAYQDGYGVARISSNYNVTKDMTIYPYYDCDSIKITYNNIENAEIEEGKELVFETTIFGDDIVLPNLIKEGYTFEGWFTQDGGYGKKIDVITSGMLTKGGATVYAHFERLMIDFEIEGYEYVATFTDGCGNVLSEQVINSENPYHTYVEIPTREGYVFGGWQIEYPHSEHPSSFHLSDYIFGDAHIYPIWRLPEWNLKPEVYSDAYIYAELINSENPYKVNISKDATEEKPIRVMFKANTWSNPEIWIKSDVDVQICIYEESAYSYLLEPVAFSGDGKYVKYDLRNIAASLYIYGAEVDGEVEIYFDNLDSPDTETKTETALVRRVYADGEFYISHVQKENYEFLGYFTQPNGQGIQVTNSDGYATKEKIFTETTKIYPHYKFIPLIVEETTVGFKEEWEIAYKNNINGDIEIKYYDQEENEVVPFEIGEYKVVVTCIADGYDPISVESKLIITLPRSEYNSIVQSDENGWYYMHPINSEPLVYVFGHVLRYGIEEEITRMAYGSFSRNTTCKAIVLDKTYTSIGGYCFEESALETIYYMGTMDEWNNIEVDENGNEPFLAATVYFYSKEEPIEAGNYWHYVDGEPTLWN